MADTKSSVEVHWLYRR